MTGTMTQAALSLLWTLLAQRKVAPSELTPSPHLQESFKALLLPKIAPLGLTLLHGHGKARPQHSKTKSPSALSRFLNRYPWPTRALIRLVRKEAQEALDRARRRKGPPPPGGEGGRVRQAPEAGQASRTTRAATSPTRTWTSDWASPARRSTR